MLSTGTTGRKHSDSRTAVSCGSGRNAGSVVRGLAVVSLAVPDFGDQDFAEFIVYTVEYPIGSGTQTVSFPTLQFLAVKILSRFSAWILCSCFCALRETRTS